ncbi:thiamine-phosphate kinase [Pseudidiomarina aestuarii]|uniref:Thiamine-monophosphate kinase n=1 Tax=Pseudidiomarina aestuarii TaxID=624146 RepID=A0A6N4DJB8_9GAMM|nr:thiamine-phosphate kinase [Pseudidiomarina aestuarii]
MAFGEFDVIETYFTHRFAQRDDVQVSVGDDGAIVSIDPTEDLVIVTDTMVAGVHFDANTPARAIGHKILAVNLSDLAAMGAEPRWFSLALTLPEINEEWLTSFSTGLKEMSEYYDCSLIGGDTTRGPLTITVTAHGVVPKGKGLLRSGAKPGDWIYVSHALGDAGLALAVQQKRLAISDPHYRKVCERLFFPTPRVALGQSLRGIASSAIDISDGLLSDLGHILKASRVGARLSLDELPLSLSMTESLYQEQALALALTSGDDYELCFTVPESQRGLFDTLVAHSATKPSCIGRITSEVNRVVLELDGEPWQLPAGKQGYQHFANGNERGDDGES